MGSTNCGRNATKNKIPFGLLIADKSPWLKRLFALPEDFFGVVYPIGADRQIWIPKKIRYAPPTHIKVVNSSEFAAKMAPMPNSDAAITKPNPSEPPRIVATVRLAP